MNTSAPPRRAHGARSRPRRSAERDIRLAGLDPVQKRRKAYEIEYLEKRTLLSFPPLPIVPDKGESNLLQQADKFELKDQLNALDQFPIPFAVVAQHAGDAPVVTKNNPHSGAPMRVIVDVDNDPTTGQGGKDVSVEVNTELFLGGVFNPHLLVTMDRIGSAPFASDFELLVSFPFSAFNTELLPGNSNLFIGYKTTGAGGPDDPGGIAPLREAIRFVPNVQAGAAHQVEIQLDTTGASNPLQFQTGFFNGTNLTGILDAAAYAAWVEEPPQNVTIGVGVGSSAIGLGAIDSEFHLAWTASAQSKVVFDYLEEESGALTDSDFNTRVTFDQMPTSEELSIILDEAAGTLTLAHRANSVIGEVEILAERNDGLTITGTLTDVPTEMDLTLGLAGTVTLDVNANTLDGKIVAEKEGGFLDTSDFLGYDIGYASAGFTNAPDLTAGYIPALDQYGVQATNPGECIDAIELIIGDDADLELPPGPPDNPDVAVAPWDDPDRHVFSLVDDGTHGTAAARLVHVEQATLDLNATDISEAFTLVLCEAAPMTVYLRTTETSNIIPDHDVEVTANIHDIPEGNTTFNMDPPFGLSYVTNPPQGIEFIHIFGHVDNTNFDMIAGNLPAVFSYAFDPDGSLAVTADDGDGVPEPNTPGDQIGLLGLIASNAIDPEGLSGATADLFGTPIRDAAFRVDDIPSFNATWSDAAGSTAINFDTVSPDAFLGGAQVNVSTEVIPLAHLPAVLPGSAHYLTFTDAGGTDKKQLAAGAFGIDAFSYSSNDPNSTYAVSYDADGARQLIVTFDSAFGGKFFPQFDTNATFTITNVPQAFNFTADLDPGFRYTASAPISSITLTGTIDDTDDAVANGTVISFSFNNLPSVVRFSLETGDIKVIDGLLDINGDDAVNGSDDGVAGGITVIDGKLDTNFNGVIDAGDDDTFLGAGVIDGGIDVNLSGGVDGSDDGVVNGLELKMNGNVNSINLSLSSENAIFGTPYQLAQVAIMTVPAHTLATWANKRILVETKDAGGAPLPLGQVTALLSTDNDAPDIATKLEPFTTTGPGGARVNYSPFLQEIDNRYLNDGGSSSVIPRLNELYNDGEALDPGEDHLVGHVQGSTLDIASFQFTGFQKLFVAPDLNGGTYEFRKPVAGVSPLFLGAGLDATIAAIQFDNIPDLMQLNTNIAGKDITWHTEDDVFDSIGDVDVYVGPAGMAQDNQAAGRFVMKDVPSDVHIFWDFGFPNGNANFDASNEFELLFLAQDGSDRLVGALQLEDLQVGYEVGIDVFFDVDWFGPVPTELALNILTAKAGIDNDVDSNAIAANMGKPGVDGFFALYGMTNSPSALVDPAGPAPAGSEYTPDLTFLMKDFREFSLELNVGLELIPAFLSPEVELNSTLIGDFVLDFWAGHIDVTAEAFVEFGFLNVADYTDNTPIHLVPLGAPDFDNLFDVVYTFVGFHQFDDHFDPFA